MAVSKRSLIGIGTGATVVIGAVAAALINELHNGVIWWVAAGAAVLVWAGIAAALAYSASQPARPRQGPGSVYTGGSIRGPVDTKTHIEGQLPPTTSPDADGLGAGAVRADDSIDGGVSTTVDIKNDPTTP